MFRRMLSAVILLGLLASIGCSESRAEKLGARASDLARSGEFDAAIGLLEDLKRKFPESRAAQGVDRQIKVFRGLQEAALKEKRRGAEEDLIVLGRLLSDYRAKQRRFPASLEALSAEGTVPTADPWGRPFRYQCSEAGDRYRLGSLGADGAPGGNGDDQDLLVDTGTFVQSLSWEDQ
jgi:hypothetical protein